MRRFSQEDALGYILDMVSIMVGVENLEENRQQTADNDVQKANDKQYEALVAALKKENSEQAAYILRYTKDRLDRIESKLNALFYEVVNPGRISNNSRIEWSETLKSDQPYKPNYISKKEGE